MRSLLSWLYKAYLMTTFRDRLSIASDVIIPWSATFIIDNDSSISIRRGVAIRESIELRATRNSHLEIREEVRLDRYIRIIATNSTKVLIGRRTRIGLGSVFNGGGNITIGENTLISGYVYLQTSMHNHTTPLDIMDGGYVYGDITIGKGSWLGVHVVIFPDVTLGQKTVVGSNAVVTRSFEAKSVVGGIPAKVLN